MNGLRTKASGIIAKRQTKAAELAESRADSDKESSEEEVAVMLAAPQVGSIAAQPSAVPKRKARAKARSQKDRPEREESPKSDATKTTLGKASKGGSQTHHTLDVAAAERLSTEDPELKQVVDRLGYVPECFANLCVGKMFSGKLGRSLHQASHNELLITVRGRVR